MSNVVIRLRTDSKQALTELGKVRKSFADLTTSKGWKNVVTGIGVGAGVGAFNALTSAIRDIPAAALAATQAASDLAEAQNKVSVVFGDSATSIEAFAATAARSMGASRTEALSAAGTFGNLFTTMGLGQQDAAAMSRQLLQLAGDLASFNNIATSDALQKLRSGLVGEAEPLRSLGVQLTEAAVAAKAVEMGLAATTASVSQAAKLQARYALILAQTTTAQGDYARTADGMANAQRSLSAEIADLQAEAGQALLPVMQDLVKILRDDLVPTLRELTPGVKAFADSVGGLGGVLQGVGVFIASVAAGLGALPAGVLAAAFLGFKALQDAINGTNPGFAQLDANLRGLPGPAAEAAKSLRDFRAAERDSLTPRTPPVIGAPTIDEASFTRSNATLRDKGREAADAIRDGLADGYDNIRGAMQTLVDAMADAKPAAQRAGELVGLLASTKVVAGLKSGDPYVRAAAQALVASTVEELKALGYKALALGYETAQMLAKGMARPGDNQMISNNALNALKEYQAFLKTFGNTKVDWPEPPSSLGSATFAAASSTAELVKQAREAVATLSGLRGMIGQLTATMSAGWTPVVLTAAQAQANLTAATASFNGALARLKPGVASTLTAVTSAFGRMKQAALDFYAAQRDARVADLNNAIAAVQANVAAFRNQLDGFRQARQQADLEEAARNARGIYSNALDAEIASLTAANAEKARTEEETRLKLAVTQARTRKDRAAAQAALEAYYARVHLEDLQSQRERQVAVENADEALLDFQQDTQLAQLQSAADAQTALLNQQIEAANAQYDAQVSALERIAAAVEEGLDSVKAIWESKNKQVLALLNGFTSQFRAAGAALAAAFAEGLGSATSAVSSAASSVTSGATAAVGSATRTVTSAANTAATAATTAATAATTASNAASLIVSTPIPVPTSPVEAPRVGGGNFLHRAAGGPVTSGKTYLVGERGPEVLTMGVGQSGYVTPGDRVRGGGDGQPVIVQLVADGRELARLVDKNLFYAYRTAARTGSAI